MKANSYIHHIAKDLIQWMPLAQFEGEVVIVDAPEKVPEAVAYLNGQDILGVDTEARPSFTRGVHYPTALVQIAHDTESAIKVAVEAIRKLIKEDRKK